MAIRSRFQDRKGSVALGALAVVLAMAVLPQAASAGFLDRLFGDVRRAIEAPRQPSLPFLDPLSSLANHLSAPAPEREQLRADSAGPAKAFCVRTCDGHFFPVQAHAGVTAAESCRSFCPTAETRLYGGSNIDTATASDGGRYADLPNAFVYRKAIVSGCTCNGKNAFGLARLDATTDPTLRQGDIVATKTGLVAFTGSRNNVADFTPVENYSRLSKATRDKLAETKIMPPTPGAAAAADITSSITPVTDNPRDPNRGRVQLAR